MGDRILPGCAAATRRQASKMKRAHSFFLPSFCLPALSVPKKNKQESLFWAELFEGWPHRAKATGHWAAGKDEKPNWSSSSFCLLNHGCSLTVNRTTTTTTTSTPYRPLDRSIKKEQVSQNVQSDSSKKDLEIFLTKKLVVAWPLGRTRAHSFRCSKKRCVYFSLLTPRLFGSSRPLLGLDCTGLGWAMLKSISESSDFYRAAAMYARTFVACVRILVPLAFFVFFV